MKLHDIIRETSGFIMMLAFMSCYVPQILKIIRTQSSTDISVGMIILGLIGYIFGMIYMLTNVFGLWWFLNYFTGIITSLVLLFYWYRHK